MTYKTQLKNELARYLDCTADEIILTWKGRIGLYGMLEGLGIGEDDEVIIPAYTCVVVPNAILYLKAQPIYVDIDPQTYNIDTSKIEAKITDRTKVIIAQNTYGLSSDVDRIKAIADKYGLKVLEDCTHGFGGTYKGVKNGKNVDSAFYSSQWNKMFSTGIGGISITRDPALKKAMLDFEKRLEAPSQKEAMVLKAQMIIKDLIGYSTAYWSAIKFYRYLTAKNIILGSSSGDELTTIKMPEGYLKGFSEVQAKRALKELQRIDQNIQHRQQNAAYFDSVLQDLGIAPPYVPDYAMHTYTKYPLLVKDRTRIFVEAEKSNLPIHDWFTSPLHPVTNLKLWDFDPAEFPVAMMMSKHVINLPTDFSVNPSMKKRIAAFLKEHQAQLINATELLATNV